MIISVGALVVFLVIAFVALHLALAVSFAKAGITYYWAFVPVVNLIKLANLVKRPKYWVWLSLIPFAGLVFTLLLFLDLLTVFKKKPFGYFLATMLLGPFFLLPLSLTKGYQYDTNFTRKQHLKPFVQELAEALVVTIFYINIILKIFLFEAFSIPTESMEATLLKGDYLVMEKLSYGARLPITPVALPFAHNNVGNAPSYWGGVQLPYLRLPRLSSIKRNDVVVFNYPMDDTRPTDRRQHYIKRCVALPGDTLLIINKLLRVNEVLLQPPIQAKFSYVGVLANDTVTPTYFAVKGFGLPNYIVNKQQLQFCITPTMADSLRKMAVIDTVVSLGFKPDDAMDEAFKPNGAIWNLDCYGPLIVPKKGATVTLTQDNIKLYKRIITVYEGNTLQVNGPYFKLNGQNVATYTFKEDYYFVMGDNRDFSADSRLWGFVPEDHMVGRAWFTWFSLNEETRSIRWNRIFKWIK